MKAGKILILLSFGIHTAKWLDKAHRPGTTAVPTKSDTPIFHSSKAFFYTSTSNHMNSQLQILLWILFGFIMKCILHKTAENPLCVFPVLGQHKAYDIHLMNICWINENPAWSGLCSSLLPLCSSPASVAFLQFEKCTNFLFCKRLHLEHSFLWSNSTFFQINHHSFRFWVILLAPGIIFSYSTKFFNFRGLSSF